jgi:hypothetical protein
LLEFVQKNASRAVRDAIRKGKLTVVGRYVTANPLLNQVDHPKIIMPVSTSSDTVSS